LISNDFDSTFPAIAFGYPIWRGLTIDDNHKVKMVWPNYLNTRSQDLETVYHDAGQWYWFNTKMITDSLFTSNSGTLVLSENEVQDIDTLSDWNLTELKYKLNKYTNE
jgi:N-acylneuraminate cytidylyltransferase